MSFGLSQRCLGTLRNQRRIGIGILARVDFDALAFNGTFARCRGYAQAASKQKATRAAKGSTAKAAPSAAAKVSSAQANLAPQTSEKDANEVATKQEKKTLSEEEQLEQIEKLMMMSKLYPTLDVWGQKVETLDVMIPHSVLPTQYKNYPGLRAMWRQFVQNQTNRGKNATSMLFLAQADAIPGFDLSNATRLQKYITRWPWKLLTTTSVRKGSWMAPLRSSVLETYQGLNTALANQDSKEVKFLTASAYQEEILRVLKRRLNPGRKYIWRFHREVSPTRVLSIRATEGYLGNEEPKFGNRMMVHALVKLDTEQSLEIYDKWGKPLHTPAEDEPASRGLVPAERRRVTEFLVFEKRMWYDGPWVIREQLWEAPGRQSAY